MKYQLGISNICSAKIDFNKNANTENQFEIFTGSKHASALCRYLHLFGHEVVIVFSMEL